jgi:integrase
MSKLRSPQTRKLYFGDWKRFLEWADLIFPDEHVSAGVARFFDRRKAEGAQLLHDYLEYLKDEGKAPATRARARQSVASVVHKLYLADLAPWTLSGLVNTPRVRAYRDTAGVTHEQWKELLAAVQSDGTALGVRDTAILLLLHDAALRRREVAALETGNVDTQRGLVWIWPKGGEVGELVPVPVNARTVDALRAWKRRRPRVAHNALFTNGEREPLSPDSIGYVVRSWCRRAGVFRIGKDGLPKLNEDGEPVTYGPHALRHAAITRLALKGKPPVILQRFARHASFDTTTHYIDNTDGAVRELTDALGDDADDEG